MTPRSSFFILAVAFLLSAVSANVDGEENSVKFTYNSTGSSGPSKWGELSPSYSPCSTGTNQSPVNIIGNQTIHNKSLKPLYQKYSTVANATLINFGFVVGMIYNEKVGGFWLNGKKYKFEQMHWHTPSEHQIDGESFEAELHLVHEADDHTVSVISILYRYGDPDPLLNKIQKYLYQMAGMNSSEEAIKIPTGKLNTKHMRRNTRKYYTYNGSFTTPPCTEEVTWIILTKVRSISRKQVDALRAPLEQDYRNNSRPVQALNGRRIELYTDLLAPKFNN